MKPMTQLEAEAIARQKVETNRIVTEYVTEILTNAEMDILYPHTLATLKVQIENPNLGKGLVSELGTILRILTDHQSDNECLIPHGVFAGFAEDFVVQNVINYGEEHTKFIATTILSSEEVCDEIWTHLAGHYPKAYLEFQDKKFAYFVVPFSDVEKVDEYRESKKDE